MTNRTFDPVAPYYVLLEKLSFGNGLDIARRAFIETVLQAKNTLMIGEGNGRFLHDCLQSKTGGSITILDSSRKMLDLLALRIKRIRHETDVELVCEGILDWQPENAPAFDVVVTHFFLDLFRPAFQRSVVEKITRVAKRETSWILVDYHPAKKTGLVRLINWLQYRFDRLLSGVETDRHYDPSAFIKEFGWTVQQERRFLNGTVVAQLLVRES
jgi:ubiquinone/menaquinone biosynthesis C-methylase UbiE